MRRLLCWLLGHDCLVTRARRRVCLRCGRRETLRDYGNVLGWEVSGRSEIAPGAPRPGRERA